MRLVFVDTETTGLDPDLHEIWEVGVVVRDQPDNPARSAVAAQNDPETIRREFVWQLPVDLSRADPFALNVGRYFDRRGEASTVNYLPGLDAFDQSGNEINAAAGPGRGGPVKPKVLHRTNLPWWSDQFSRLTWGATMIGAGVSFDTDRLGRLLRTHGACPGWYYHVIDVEELAAGFAIGRCHGIAVAGDITLFGGAVDAAHLARSRPWKSDDVSRTVGVDPDRFEKHTALGDARWAEAVWDEVHHPKRPTLAADDDPATDPWTVATVTRPGFPVVTE